MAQGKPITCTVYRYSYIYTESLQVHICMVVRYTDCPAAEGIGACIVACSDNSNCANGQLCCSNGCGYQCMTPVIDPCAVSACDDHVCMH